MVHGEFDPPAEEENRLGMFTGLVTNETEYRQLRRFLSRKVARALMDLYGLSGKTEPGTDNVVASILGTFAENGIGLSARNTTTAEDIERESARLLEQIKQENEAVVPLFGELAEPYMQAGIDFHRTDILPRSERFNEWYAEYLLHRDAGLLDLQDS